MKLNGNIQIHEVAGEKIAMINDKNQMMRVISFNDTALCLWNSLLDKEFEVKDVESLLLEKYDVDEKTAKNDAANWVKTLQENGMLA